METEAEIRERNLFFEERERRRRAESLLSLAEAELDDARADARLARRFAIAFAALATGATLAFLAAAL